MTPEDIKNNMAFRPTQLVNSKYKLTPVQNDIIDFILSEINQEKKLGIDEHKVLYQISVTKYKNTYDTKSPASVYRYLKEGVDTFQNTKGFYLISRHGNPLFVQWLSSIEYISNQGIIEVEISQKFKEFLWESKQALFYEIQYSVNLKNEYSKRLYFYLRDKRKFKEYVVSIETLGDIFIMPETYVKNFSKIKKNVLDVAMKEINNNTDISFRYEQIKGRKKSGQMGITKIKFIITVIEKTNYVAMSEVEEYEQIMDIITTCTKKQAKEMYDLAMSKNMTFNELLDIVKFCENASFVSDKVAFAMYTINQTETKEPVVIEQNDDGLINEIVSRIKCSKKEAHTIKTTGEKNNHNEQEILEIIDYVNAREGINNKPAYIVSILKNGYIENKMENNDNVKVAKSKTTNKFNDFSQRHYSEEQMQEIERKLLSR